MAIYAKSKEDGAYTPPGNYDGTAFMRTESESAPQERPPRVIGEPTGETKLSPLLEGGGIPALDPEPSEKAGLINDSVASGLPLFSGLGALPFKLPSLSFEDLLILAVAAFLFFSKSGDKECAIMLAVLLFIG